jgi:hypothetical protein
MARFRKAKISDAFAIKECKCGYKGRKIDFNKNATATCGKCPECQAEVEI